MWKGHIKMSLSSIFQAQLHLYLLHFPLLTLYLQSPTKRSFLDCVMWRQIHATEIYTLRNWAYKIKACMISIYHINFYKI